MIQRTAACRNCFLERLMQYKVGWTSRDLAVPSLRLHFLYSFH